MIPTRDKCPVDRREVASAASQLGNRLVRGIGLVLQHLLAPPQILIPEQRWILAKGLPFPGAANRGGPKGRSTDWNDGMPLSAEIPPAVNTTIWRGRHKAVAAFASLSIKSWSPRLWP